MMSTHNFDHPLYSTTWTLSDYFPFLFVNTVFLDRFTSVLINILFRIYRIYQKSEENVGFTLHKNLSFAHPV